MRIGICGLILICTISSLVGEDVFGYISHSTINIGDDIQTIAAKRFLPDNAVAIDREFISAFNYPSMVNAVVSGWFMHEKGGYWDLPTLPPEKSWPPAPEINPFFISIHLTGTIQSTIFSKENIEYLKEHGPIGARDLFTLNELLKRNIPSYFSGCLTLTLENNFTERNDITYLVDLDEETVTYIKSRVKTPIVVITHGKPLLQLLSPDNRLKYAEYILNLYRKAKCVVTTRLHAAMPCLAFETPVLMIEAAAGSTDCRFIGLLDHTSHCTKSYLMEGGMDYYLDNPTDNPKTYLPMRENLITIMENWVKKT